MSHKSTIHLLDQLGQGHDMKVHQWKGELLTHMQLNQVCILLLLCNLLDVKATTDS